MDELVRWLGEQLDEDERIARSMNSDPVASMARKFEADALRLRSELKAGKSERVPYDEGQADALHWAAVVLPERMPALSPFGQARVLHEIDAKRRLLDVHRPVQQRSTGSGGGLVQDCQVCGHFPAQYPCLTLRLLGLPYADRNGYRSEWRP